MVDDPQIALAQTALAAERGADLVELRLDNIADQPDAERRLDIASQLIADSPLPCIVTIRPNWEGGDFEGHDSDRLDILETLAAAPRPPLYIDLELIAYRDRADVRNRIDALLKNPSSPSLFLSSHDFKTRPRDLMQRIEAMAAQDNCTVIKVAWQARSLRDNIEAFEILDVAPKPAISLCMGEFGLASRVLAKKFGALLTFAALNDREVTAPGQVGVQTLKELYRWDSLNAATKVYGVIGHPIAHSMSPAIHNAGFDATHFNGVYLPMPIPPQYEHFKATLATWLDYKPLHFAGASVTIPHKQNLLKFVEQEGGQIEPLAQQIGAANTLTVRTDGSLYASNTDYAAALDAVCDAMQITRDQLAGKRVAVIGAGGVSRAIVAGFAGCGCDVTIYNRTIENANELAQRFEHPGADHTITSAPMAALHESQADVYINGTPIGMHPNIDESPLNQLPLNLPKNTVFFDTIYNPVETQFLKMARQAGHLTISGVEMFVRQAAWQFELWTGEKAPTDIFEQVVLDRLAPTETPE